MSFAYFDHNAGTGLNEGVLDVMLPYLQQQQGNPSSSHRFGRFAQAGIDKARQQVADLVGVTPAQVIFTSGGTEANNQAIAGIAAKYNGGRLLIGSTEHPALIEPAKRLQQQGYQLDWLPVDEQGRITSETLQTMLQPDTRLVSVMQANNETGVIQDIPALTAITRDAGVFFHTDAVQAAGKINVDFGELGVDMLSLSAHKLGGPKGIGALVVSPQVEWPAYVLGGGQENSYRSGTENVAAIVGFGEAAHRAASQLTEYQNHCRQLRDRLEAGLKALPGVTIFADDAERLPNTVFFTLQGFDSDTMLMALDKQGYAVSSGSACGTGRQTPSHVLTAMQVDDATALGAVRVSLSGENTVQQIDGFIEAVAAEANRFNHLLNR